MVAQNQPLTSSLEKAIGDFYSELEAGEASAFRKLAVANDRVIDKLDAELKKLEKLGPVDASASWLQRERLSRLVFQAREEYDKFAAEVDLLIPDSQLAAAKRARDSMDQIFIASPGGQLGKSFSHLNDDALQLAVASLNDGSPIRELTSQYGEDAAKAMNKAYIAGVGAGNGPMEIARDMVKAGQIPHAKAKTLVRTQLMGINREISRREYLANSDIVKAWRWYARCDLRCCPVCWAMHGRTFKLQTRMATHPNCRCLNLPVMKSYDELGIPGVAEVAENPAVTVPGISRFKLLPESSQKSILGPGAFNAYRSGLIDLPDLVGESYSPKWGYGKFQRPLKDVVGGQNAKMLAKGKVPSNITPARPQILDNEAFGDPWSGAKNVLKDYSDSGKFDAGTADFISDAMNAGTWGSPEEAIAAMDKYYATKVGEVSDDIWKLHNAGVIDDSLKNSMLTDLDTYTETQLKELSSLLDELDKAHLEDLNKLQAAKISRLEDINKLLEEQKALGMIDEATYQSSKGYYNTLNNPSLDDLDAEFNMEAKFLKEKHPKTVAKAKLDDAYGKGLIPEETYQDYINLLDSSTTPDAWKAFDDIAEEAKQFGIGPTSGDIYVKHPHMAQKLDAMNNQGKISNSYKNHLVDTYSGGGQTGKEFDDLLDIINAANTPPVNKTVGDLLNDLALKEIDPAVAKQVEDMLTGFKLSKGEFQKFIDNFPDKPQQATQLLTKSYGPGSVQKSSYQLLNDLANVPGHSVQKKKLATQYKAKTINKEELQEAIDSMLFDEMDKLASYGIDPDDITKFKNEYIMGNADTDKLIEYINTVNPNYVVKPPTPTPAPNYGGWGSPSKEPESVFGPNVELNEYGLPRAILDPSKISGGGPLGPKPTINQSVKPGAIPKAGKGPYKKNVDALEALQRQGKITDQDVTEIYDLWNRGYIKNKDIENWIADINIYDSGNSFLRPATFTNGDDIRNFSWDRHLWGRSEARAHTDYWKSKATASQRKIATDYTGSFYRPLNKFARSGRVDSYHTETELRKKAKDLQESFEHAVIPRDMMVSRGTTVNTKHDWANAKDGDFLIEHGFMSSTTKPTPTFNDRSYDNEHIGARYFIYVPKGAKALDARGFSNISSEDEVIFPPGSIFKLVERRKRKDGGPLDFDFYLEWVGFKKDETPFRK